MKPVGSSSPRPPRGAIEGGSHAPQAAVARPSARLDPFATDQYVAPGLTTTIQSRRPNPFGQVTYTWKSVPPTTDVAQAKATMTQELKKAHPDAKVVSDQFNSIDDMHEQWQFVRDLKLHHPAEYKKLHRVMTQERDAAIKSAIYGGEQAVTDQAIHDHMIDLRVAVGSPEDADRETLAVFRTIHPSEREEVLWRLRESSPADYELLRGVSERSKSKALKGAIRATDDLWSS